MPDASKSVTIYTDGGCDPNPGPGGYGVVLLYGRARKELSGGFRRTTNNRMEICAAIRALECLKHPCIVTLYSDSQYVVNAMTKGWALRWQAKSWRRKSTRVPNSDLWQKLLDLCTQHTVDFRWVRGHNGNPENERCDQLATAALQAPDLPEDEGYSPDQSDEEPALLLASPEALPNPDAPAEQPESRPASSGKITHEGQPCRKCATAVIRRTPRKAPKPNQDYYYEYYLYCPACHTMYMLDEAKRSTTQYTRR